MKKFSFFSPAKVNLFFRILGRRPNGYHDIATVIQMVNFGDTLSFSFEKDADVFQTNASFLLFNEDNLIYKALQLFRKKTNLSFFVSIYLDKVIPIQAGLGGGSSNAATTLYALNHILHAGYSDEELAEIGSSLGADIPSFFSQGRVFCEGVGEILTPLSSEYQSYWIAKPKNCSLSTIDVYKGVNLQETSFLDPQDILKSLLTVEPLYVNDLEHSAFRLEPLLKELKEEYKKLGFKHVFMTGSGSAFVCIGDPKQQLPGHTMFYPVFSHCRKKEEWYSHPI